jgi:hypothetical protein
MASCDFDMRFIFVVASRPGSAHDTQLFLDTLVTYKDNFLHPLKVSIISLIPGTQNQKDIWHHTKDKGIMY